MARVAKLTPKVQRTNSPPVKIIATTSISLAEDFVAPTKVTISRIAKKTDQTNMSLLPT